MIAALFLFLQTPGEQLYQSGRFEEARAALIEEIRGGTTTPRTHFWLGYTELALGNKPAAIQPFETYLKANPKDEDVLYAVAHTYAQLAQMSLERIFAIDPKCARAYQMRGIRFELEKEWTRALEAYQTALAIDPKLRGVWSSIGRIHEKELKDAAQGRTTAAKELRGPPTQPGIGLVEQKRPRAALPQLIAWRAKQPNDPNVYYYLGEAYTDLKVATIRQLRTANPGSYRLHQILAESYASTHRQQEAIDEYRQVLKLRPDLPGVSYELARLLTESAPEEARGLLEAELKVDPAHYLARSLLGQLLVALHEPAKGLPLLEAALSARDSLTDARRALGKALMETGRPRDALAHLQRAAAENPQDEQVHFLLAQVYGALGQAEEAAAEMKIHQEVLRKLAGQ